MRVSVGPFDVDLNSTLVVNVSVTNAWAAYTFANKNMTVTVFRN